MKSGILVLVGLIFITDFLDTIGQLLLKSCINSLGMHIDSISKAWQFILKIISRPRIWISFLLSGASLLLWLFVLSRADLNLSFSLDSMRYILIAFASAIFLKERIDPLRWAGILCVVIGISLVASG